MKREKKRGQNVRLRSSNIASDCAVMRILQLYVLTFHCLNLLDEVALLKTTVTSEEGMGSSELVSVWINGLIGKGYLKITLHNEGGILAHS